MISMESAGAGLRGRILVTVGLITASIMILMSWGMLYNWRHSLLRQETSSALAVSRAFSVAVIDALIASDQDLNQSEGFLGNYVNMFMEQDPRLRAITILDADGTVTARSWDRSNPPWVSGTLASLIAAQAPTTTIKADDDGAWMLEIVLPMYTGERRWGVLVMTTEADSIRSRVRRAFFQILLLSIAVTSVMLLILWLMLSRILGSLQALVSAMDAVDFNSADIPLLPYRRDEIGVLYKHFHRMQKRAEQSRRELLAAQHLVWHAERLAAIGRLASGLAHEINNPINGIRNCIYAIRNDPDDRKQTAEYLQMMDEGAAHASNVIDKLLGFSRKRQAGFEAMDLNNAVESVLRLVSFDIERKGLVLETSLDPNLPPIMADRQLIQEVAMNLLINAVDAVEDRGRIDVATSVGDDGVVLAVSDQGHGIAPENLDRIFDPFFTTKKTGEGTGLGLSICLEIVQAQGGRIEVASRLDEGSVFTITFPPAAAKSDQENSS